MMSTNSIHFRYWGLPALAVLFLAPSLLGQAVSNLAITAATSKHVDLSWNGVTGSFNVQRRVLGGTYSTIATVSNSTYSDTQLDPYTTYEYQVTATNVASTTNAVRVGPPPAGLTSVAPAPLRGATPVDTYGLDMQMVLDGNGDPAFLYGWGDPNGDSVWSDSVLLFRSWNRAKYDWNPVVTVATVGDVLTRFRQTLALGYDATTNTFAAAAENENGNLNVYVSTNGGTTWTVKKTFQGAPGGPSWRNPSMALSGGNIHLALVSDNGLHYVNGKLSIDSSTWIDKVAPTPGGTSLALDSATTSLALDSSGNPAIVYWVDDTTSAYNEVLLYWKAAGSGGPIRALDSQAQQSDDLSVKLVFFNLNPRILAYTQRTDADFGVGVHFVRSDDGGLNWQKPVVIPPDGNSSTDFPFDLALNSRGEAAASFGQNSSSGDSVCGNPKLSRSIDLVNWKTCAIADKNVVGNYSPIPGAVQLAFGGNDRLWMAWWEQGSTPADSGILLYREPPAGAANGPVITSVVDGASFRPNIVGGSWVTIYGANLSGTTRIWADADFKGNVLPTELSGVSVKMNGLPAAVYYISPTQLNVQAPANISGGVSVQVTFNGATSNTATATAVQNAPALFSYPAGGKTYPAAVYPNSQIVGDPAISGTNVSKAHAGDRILLFGTGLVPSPAGNIVTAAIVSSSPATVSVGGTDAAVEFAGLVASGEFQINIIVPSLPPGEYPVVVKVNGQSSQTGVIIPVQ